MTTCGEVWARGAMHLWRTWGKVPNDYPPNNYSHMVYRYPMHVVVWWNLYLSAMSCRANCEDKVVGVGLKRPDKLKVLKEVNRH